MRRNKLEPLLFDPELERTICRRRAHQRLVAATAMACNGGGVPNPEEEARIEAAVQERLAQRLQEQQLTDATRSLWDQTAASITYDCPGKPTSGLLQQLPWHAMEEEFRIRRRKHGSKQQSKSALLRDC